MVKNRNTGLDIIRAAAVIMVVLSHTHVVAERFGFIGKFLKGSGTLGVELFFVLSGFLIFRILFNLFDRNDRFSYRDIWTFLCRRWFRTIPNYWVVLTITVILYNLLNVNISEPVNYLSYYIFLQNFFTEPKPFFVSSWSLSVEEFSYLLTGLFCIIVVLLKFAYASQKKGALLIIMIIAFFFFKVINFFALYYHLFPSSWNSTVRTMTFFRFDSIFMGGMLSYWFNKNRVSFFKGKTLKAVIGFSILGFGLYFQQKIIYMEDYYKYPLFSISILPLISVGIALLFPFFYTVDIKNKWLHSAVYQTSLLSYSLYLVNEQVVAISKLWINDISKLSIGQSVLIYVLLWVIIYILAVFFYNTVEKPFMKYRDKKYP